VAAVETASPGQAAGAPDDPSGDGLGVTPTTPTVKRPIPEPPGSAHIGAPGAVERDTLIETAVDDMNTRVTAAGGDVV
jgi:hypothetical protein